MRINSCKTSFIWEGVEYNENIQLHDSLKSDQGCDSIVDTYINLNPIIISDTIQECSSSLVWKNTIYSQNTIIRDTIRTDNDCDSINNTYIIVGTASEKIEDFEKENISTANCYKNHFTELSGNWFNEREKDSRDWHVAAYNHRISAPVPNADVTTGTGEGKILLLRGGRCGEHALLKSHCWDLSSFNQASLKFWYGIGFSDVRMPELTVSITSNGVTNILKSYNVRTDPTGYDQWAQDSIDLTPYTREKVTIQFSGRAGYYGGGIIYLDDIDLQTSQIITDYSLKDISSIFVRPIPASNLIQIVSDKKIAQTFISSQSGKELYQSSLFKNSIEIGDYPAGVYFIKLLTDDGAVYIKRYDLVVLQV